MNGNCLPYIMYLKIIFVSIDLKILSGHKVILNFFFFGITLNYFKRHPQILKTSFSFILGSFLQSI